MKFFHVSMLHNGFGLFCLCQLVVYSSAQSCEFPQSWQSVWFTHYDDETEAAWMYAVGPSGVIQYAPSSGVEMVFHCNSTYRPTNDVLYYVISRSQIYYCVQTYVTDDAMIVKQTELRDENKNLNAYDCPLIGRGPVFESWYIKYPFSLAGVQCPFPEGHYQAVYWQKPNQPHCEDDPSSQITISYNTLTINTCYNGSSFYSRPLHNITLTCLGDGSKSFLTNVGESVLFLLASYDNRRKSRFYCGKYQLTDSTMEFALGIADPHQAFCNDVISSGQPDSDKVIYFKLTDFSSTSTTAAAYTSDSEVTEVKLTTSQVVRTNASCLFPQKWHGYFWLGYFIAFNTYQEVIQQYLDDTMSSTIGGNTFQSFRCTDLYTDDQSVYFVRYWTADPTVRHCVRIVDRVPGLLLYQQQSLDANTFSSAEGCKAFFRNTDIYRVQVKKPASSIRCPIQGNYHVAININGTLSSQCLNDYSSIASVAGNVMIVRTCTKTDQYNMPFYSDLTCIAAWNGDYLDQVNGQKRGDYLLLSYIDTNSLVRYMCARYHLTDTGMMMSIYVKDNNTASCVSSSSYWTSEEDFRHMIFTDYASLPQPTSPSTTTTTTATTTTSTTTTTTTTTNTPNATASKINTIATLNATKLKSTPAVINRSDLTVAPTTTSTTTTSSASVIPTSENKMTKRNEPSTHNSLTSGTEEYSSAPVTTVSDEVRTLSSKIGPIRSTTFRSVKHSKSNTEYTLSRRGMTTRAHIKPRTAHTTGGTTHPPKPTTLASAQTVITFNSDRTSPISERLTRSTSRTVHGTQKTVHSTLRTGQSTPRTAQSTPRTARSTLRTINDTFRVTMLTTRPSLTKTAFKTSRPKLTIRFKTSTPPTTFYNTKTIFTTTSQVHLSPPIKTTTQSLTQTKSKQTTTITLQNATKTAFLKTTFLKTTPIEVVNISTTTPKPTETCVYPSKLRRKHWWFGYQRALGRLHEQTKQYLATEQLTGIEMNGEILYIHYTCEDYHNSGRSEYFLKYLTSQPTEKTCVQVVSEVEGILLTRELPISLKSRDKVTALDCQQVFSAEASYRVHVEKPFKYDQSACPLPPGSYHTIISVNNVSKDICRYDNASLTIVTESTMTVKSCLNINTYNNPFMTEFHCVRYWPGELLDKEMGSQRGDYLLLAYQDNDTFTKFICARYHMTANGMQMSLNVQYPLYSECDTKNNYQTTGGQFRYFEFSAMKMMTVEPATVDNTVITANYTKTTLQNNTTQSVLASTTTTTSTTMSTTAATEAATPRSITTSTTTSTPRSTTTLTTTSTPRSTTTSTTRSTTTSTPRSTTTLTPRSTTTSTTTSTLRSTTTSTTTSTPTTTTTLMPGSKSEGTGPVSNNTTSSIPVATFTTIVVTSSSTAATTTTTTLSSSSQPKPVMFPSSLTNSEWLMGYEPSTTGYVPLTVRFIDDKVIYYANKKETHYYVTDDVIKSDNIIYYLSHDPRKPVSRQCVQVLDNVGGLLLIRETHIEAHLSASFCKHQFSKTEPYQVFVKESVSAMELNCPFSQGIFQVTYKSTMGLRYCVGNFNSTATVEGSKITMRACQQPRENSVPYKSDLFCVRRWPIELLDRRMGTNNGGYLLLSYREDNVTKFICARYKTEGGSTELSLPPDKELTATCHLQRNNDLFEADSVLFVLNELNECSSNPCLNSGTCYDIAHGYYCRCPEAVIGTNCQTSVEEVSMRKDKDVVSIVIIAVVIAVVVVAAVIIGVLYSQMRSRKVPSTSKRAALEKSGIGHSGAAVWYPDYARKTPGNLT